MGVLTLATGSVIPAMIVHIGNNSLAVWAMLNNLEFEGMPPWAYVLGFLGQIILVALILKWGKGYPGTKWHRE